MKHLKLILFALLCCTQIAANKANDCGARLEGDRYFGAFNALVKSGKLELHHIREAVRSDSPYDPYAIVTPGSKDSAGKAFFAQAVQDESVHARWPETKILLEKLRAELEGLAYVREDAAEATALIYVPQEIHSISGPLGTIPWTVLPDGRTAIVYRENVNHIGSDFVVATPEGKEIYRFGPPVRNMSQTWVTGWHKDQSGKLWLYVATAQHLCRMDWSDKQFVEFPGGGSGGWSPKTLTSVGNKYMIMGTGSDGYFDVSTGKLKKIKKFNGFPADRAEIQSHQAATLDSDGELLVRPRIDSSLAGSRIAFTASSGESYFISGELTDLEIRGIKNSFALDIPGDTGAAQLAATEMPDGRLLVAKLGSGEEGYGVTLYEPFKSKEPIFSYTIPNSTALHVQHMRWFKGAHGETILGIVNAGQIWIANPADKSVVPVADAKGFQGWFTAGNQTYYYKTIGQKRHIFTLMGVAR